MIWIERILLAGIWFFAGWSIGKGSEIEKKHDRIINGGFACKENRILEDTCDGDSRKREVPD